MLQLALLSHASRAVGARRPGNNLYAYCAFKELAHFIALLVKDIVVITPIPHTACRSQLLYALGAHFGQAAQARACSSLDERPLCVICDARVAEASQPPVREAAINAFCSADCYSTLGHTSKDASQHKRTWLGMVAYRRLSHAR